MPKYLADPLISYLTRDYRAGIMTLYGKDEAFLVHLWKKQATKSKENDRQRETAKSRAARKWVELQKKAAEQEGKGDE